ncbi:hypothetical protein ES708_07412 [subsurface metagenome]
MEQREPEENQTTEIEPEVAELDDIETLKQVLDEQKKGGHCEPEAWQSRWGALGDCFVANAPRNDRRGCSSQ